MIFIFFRIAITFFSFSFLSCRLSIHNSSHLASHWLNGLTIDPTIAGVARTRPSLSEVLIVSVRFVNKARNSYRGNLTDWEHCAVASDPTLCPSHPRTSSVLQPPRESCPPVEEPDGLNGRRRMGFWRGTQNGGVPDVAACPCPNWAPPFQCSQALAEVACSGQRLGRHPGGAARGKMQGLVIRVWWESLSPRDSGWHGICFHGPLSPWGSQPPGQGTRYSDSMNESTRSSRGLHPDVSP